MKLYATIQSERAIKGQGGNNYIEVNFIGEHNNKERENLGRIDFIRDGSMFRISYCGKNNKIVTLVDSPVKGKKEKGEKCYCSDDDISIPHYH